MAECAVPGCTGAVVAQVWRIMETTTPGPDPPVVTYYGTVATIPSERYVAVFFEVCTIHRGVWG